MEVALFADRGKILILPRYASYWIGRNLQGRFSAKMVRRAPPDGHGWENCQDTQNSSTPVASMKLAGQLKTRRGLFAVTAAAIFSWGIYYGKALAANVTASWSYEYSPMPACSPGRTNNCIDHFEVLDITDQQDKIPIRSVGNPSRPYGKVDNISTSFRYGPPFGQRTISVIAVGHDAKGNRVESNPFATQVTVSIRPGVKLSLFF